MSANMEDSSGGDYSERARLNRIANLWLTWQIRRAIRRHPAGKKKETL